MNYFGLVALDAAIPLWVVVRNTSQVPTAPDSAPTFSVYEGGSDTPQTNGSAVSMTGPVNSETGLYRKSHDATAANGYESGKTYLVKFNYAISSTNYTQIGTFTVV